jgi:hypothetical protein
MTLRLTSYLLILRVLSVSTAGVYSKILIAVLVMPLLSVLAGFVYERLSAFVFLAIL